MNKWAKWFNKGCFLAIGILLGSNYSYAFQQNIIGNDVLPDSALLVLPDTSGIIGTSLSLDILLANNTGTELNSFQFGIAYDTAMVGLEGFNPNEEVLANATFLANDSIPGVVYFSAASADEILSGGLVAAIDLTLKSLGQTHIHVINALFNEGQPPVAVRGGRLIIEEEPDTIPPIPPQNLEASLQNPATVELRWTTGQDLDLKQYYIYEYQGDVPQDPMDFEQIGGVLRRDSLAVGSPAPLGADLQIQIDGLENLSYYHYWVTALDSTGNESLPEYIRIRSGDAVAPDAPSLSNVLLEGREILVEWDASPSSDVAGYVLYRSEESLTEGYGVSDANYEQVIATPGQVEWMVLYDWDTQSQSHRLLLDLREFPEDVDPSEVRSLSLLDVYTGPVEYANTGSDWVTYFIPEQIYALAIQASEHRELFRDIGDAYGVRVELAFEPLDDVAPVFQVVEVFGPQTFSYTDVELYSRHFYSYKVAAFDSANGDPLVSFDPEWRSDYSGALSVETPSFAWKVNPTGQGDFEYIQDAIDMSEPGDTILVDPGTYVEKLSIAHPLTLRATGDFGDVRLVKPPFVDTLVQVSADEYVSGRWPLGEQLTWVGFDVWGIEEVATSGVGMALGSGTRATLNRMHMTQFVEVFNTFEASLEVSNSIFYENRRLGTHSNNLTPDASGADSIRYQHVNVLNVYDKISTSEGAIAIEFRNSVLVDQRELALEVTPFEGNGVRLIDVAMDTHVVRRGIDMTVLNDQEFLATGYQPSLVHLPTLEQVLFQRLYSASIDADYRLQPHSLLIGQAKFIPGLGKDFAGSNRSKDPEKRVDIGAFEHPRDTPLLFSAPVLSISQIELPTQDPVGPSRPAIEIALSVEDTLFADGYSLMDQLDALYLYKLDQQGSLIRIDTLQPGIFIDAEVEEGRGYGYWAQARYFDIYQSKQTDEQSLFINDVTPPRVVDSLSAIRLGTRVFEFSWKADTTEELSAFRIYRAQGASQIQAYIDTVDTTWMWQGGIMDLETLKALEVPVLDSVMVQNSTTEENPNLHYSYVEDDLMLTNRSYYTYWLTSVDTSGNESDPRFIRIRTGDDIPPQAPKGIRQTVLSGRIIVQWNPNLGEDVDIETFRIYRGEDSLNVSLYAEVEGNKGTFVDDSLDNIVSVFYRVSAVDSVVGDPAFSFDPALEGPLSASTTGYFVDLRGPQKPEILNVSSANNQVQFSWKIPPDIDLDYHRIYRGFHPDTVVLLDTTSRINGQYIDDSVENGRSYYYYVSGVDTANNEGDRSDLVIGNPFNLPPVVANYQDLYLHNQEVDQLTLPFTFQAFDADGSIDSTLWYVDGDLVATSALAEITVLQGSTSITMIAVDDDAARDTNSFSVYMDAGYTELANSLAPSTGFSLFGNDFSFLPDGKGNLNLMVRNQANEFSLDAPLRSPVAIAKDSTFYLISGTNNFRKYSLFNWWKHKITIPYWTMTTGGLHESSPVLDEVRKRIYAVSADNQIFAISMATGAQVWRSNVQASGIHPGVLLDGQYLAQPNVLGDIVYFDLDGSISFKEMAPIGSSVFGDSLLGALAVSQSNELVAAYSSGKVRKWKPNFAPSFTTELIWEVELGGAFTTTPVIAEDGTVLVGGADSTFYGLNGSSGQVKWTFTASDAISSTASINEYGVIYFGDRSGRVYALSPEGGLIWEYQVPEEEGDGNGQSQGSSSKWIKNLGPQSILNTINYANGSVFFGTVGGKLFRVRDGWRYDGTQEGEFGPEWERSFAQWATYQGNYQRSGVVDGWSATSNEQLEQLPTEFALSQNYPNPFNPSTQIGFSIPEASQVQLEVFNMLGQKVQTLKNERMAAGYYSVVFEAGGLSSGVYFYQLRMGNQVLTKQMLLLK